MIFFPFTSWRQLSFNINSNSLAQYCLKLRVNCSEVGNENPIQILQQSNKAILLNNEKNQLKWISLLSLLFYKKPWQLLAKKEFIASSRNDSHKRNFSSLFLQYDIKVHFHIHKWIYFISLLTPFWHLRQCPSQTCKNWKYVNFSNVWSQENIWWWKMIKILLYNAFIDVCANFFFTCLLFIVSLKTIVEA